MGTQSPVLDHKKEWIMISVRVTRTAEEQVSSLLFDLGTTGIATLAETGHAVELGAYFSQLSGSDHLLTVIQDAISQLGLAGDLLAISSEDIPDQDWMQKWKEGFEATEVGERLIVVPSWKLADVRNREKACGASHDTSAVVRSRLAIQIDPGMAFGTGTHETTRLCLELIERSWKGGRLLDIGTGTGILSIAAALLVPESSITAIDIDPVAVGIARENVEINNVRAAVTVFESGPGDFGNGDFDLIVANLTADTIVALIGEINKCMRPDGRCILSGILCEFAGDVDKAVARSGLAVIERRESGEWAALVAYKAGRASDSQ